MGRPTYIPKLKLNDNQITTMGAYVVPSFDVPKGCIRKRRINIAQVTPIIVLVEILGATTFKPWERLDDTLKFQYLAYPESTQGRTERG